jgi:hypothetical protein
LYKGLKFSGNTLPVGLVQQRFQEMAKNVQNSHFSFARIFILAESTQLRSSPLLEAAERWAIA